MRVECFGQTRPQDGRQQAMNQDAFAIGRQPHPWLALCDGAGNAQSVAKRALALLETRIKETPLGELLREQAWVSFGRWVDSALNGGPETTLVAVATVGSEVIGIGVGDSRAYLVPLEGPTRLLTEGASKARLGSGETEPFAFRATLDVRDVILLVSDGAWTPLGTSGLESVVRAMGLKPFADLPSAVLDAASRRGRADDMTAVALRQLRS